MASALFTVLRVAIARLSSINNDLNVFALIVDAETDNDVSDARRCNVVHTSRFRVCGSRYTAVAYPVSW